jgi:two-component system, NtrC family, response regulator AtoC
VKDRTSERAINVLIVDDEVKLAQAFSKKLGQEGMKVSLACSGKEALSIAEKENVDVAVLDLRLPDTDGVDLLTSLKAVHPTLEVVIVTGYASVDTAIRSMKRGAYDYLTKPVKLTELSALVVKAFEKKELHQSNIVLKEHFHRSAASSVFVGESPGIKGVKRLISVVAPSSTPVLILGETGTGKELVARAIHQGSPRYDQPFVAVNSSTLQGMILESELFGYRKGAFTGADADKIGLLEIAHRGTFFVDEIGDMESAIQAKCLRVLETGTFRKVGDTREINVDARLVFATNKNLELEVESGRFRKDLFYRLSAFTILVPPLREHPTDIPLLVEYFLNRLARGGKRKIMPEEVLKALGQYSWPGNVRELANMLERAVLLAQSREEIGFDEFPPNIFFHSEPTRSGGSEKIARQKGDLDLAFLEREHIQRVLESVGGNKSKAARLLGISRKKLYAKIDP